MIHARLACAIGLALALHAVPLAEKGDRRLAQVGRGGGRLLARLGAK